MGRFGLFQLGELNYSLPLPQIKKIRQGAALFALPRLPEGVVAVLVDDGQLIPLLDLNMLTEAPAGLADAGSGYQILVDSEYGTVALPARLTGKIVTEGKGELLAAKESQPAWIAGEFVYQGTKYMIIDINFLAVEMTQNFWYKQPDPRGARRLG